MPGVKCTMIKNESGDMSTNLLPGFGLGQTYLLVCASVSKSTEFQLIIEASL